MEGHSVADPADETRVQQFYERGTVGGGEGFVEPADDIAHGTVVPGTRPLAALRIRCDDPSLRDRAQERL
jgi:hypothetical protein